MTRNRLHLVLMLALTFSTGVVDAVGYLGFDKTFTANMTGNVVILGMGIAGADNLPVLRPALALAFFMFGAAIGGRVHSQHKGIWNRSTTVLFGLVGLGMLLSAGFIMFAGAAHAEFAGTITTSAIATLMGLQATAARRLGVTDVTTVVVTSTIVGLASDSRLAGGNSEKWVRRVIAVAMILLGALVGALSLSINHWIGVVLAAVIILGCTLWGELVRRHDEARVPA